MKILHTSDLHFGISLCGVSLLPYQKKFCEELCRAAADADIVIVSGDVFDTSVASSEAVKCWSELVTRLCLEMKKTVVVCAGNHDGAARLASCSDLLRAAGLHISGSFDDAFVPVVTEDAEIYSVPYFNAADWAVLLGCRADSASVMAAVTKKILVVADKSKKIILAAHCFAAGGKAAESDISARAAESVGGADNIPLSVFDGFDYVALGHLHRPQTLGDGRIRYSGTPMAYSFGEAGQEKSVSVYDTETGEISVRRLEQPYRLRTVEGEYEDILRCAEEDSDRDDFMKIAVTDRYAGDNMFMRLKELYPNLLHFSGKMSGGGQAAEEITEREAAELDIISLAARYCEEKYGEAPDEDEMRWLAAALEDIERESS